MTVDERLNELEARYTLQQQQLDSLNGVLWEQQRTVDALVREVQRLRDRLEAQGAPSPVTGEDEGPPPHY
jgi:SlyX protein